MEKKRSRNGVRESERESEREREKECKETERECDRGSFKTYSLLWSGAGAVAVRLTKVKSAQKRGER